MVREQYQLNGHEWEQTLEESEGQGSLACCSPWGHKELDMTIATKQQQKVQDMKVSIFHLRNDHSVYH